MMLSMTETDYENWRDDLAAADRRSTAPSTQQLLSMKGAGGQMPFLT